jgi:uncharacterized protein (TIGR03546 family)
MTARTAQTLFASKFAASSREQPWAWALAIAIGLAFGLMPKGNLIAVGLVVAACFLRIHHPVAIITGILGTLSNGVTDPWMDRLGQSLLGSAWLQPLWQQFSEWPVLPWLQWNNSIVMGSFVFAFASLPLLYSLSLVFVRKRAPRAISNSVDWSAQILEVKSRKSVRDGNSVSKVLKSSVQKISEQIESTPALGSSKVEDSLQEPHLSRQRSVKKRQQVEHRIDIQNDLPLAKPNVAAIRPITEAVMAIASQADESSAILHETVIEIVRYRPKEAISEQPRVRGPLTRRNTFPNSSSNETSTTSDPMSMPPVEHKSTTIDSAIQPMVQMPKMDFSNDSTDEGTSSERPREEALRYLLWHLSGVRHPSSSLQERAS